MHLAGLEIALIDHFLVFEFHLSQTLNNIRFELSGVHSETRLEFIDAHSVFHTTFEVSIVQITILILDLAFAVHQAALEHTLIL